MLQRNLTGGVALAIAAMLVVGGSTQATAGLGQIDGPETKCGATLGKASEKLAKTYIKEVTKCRDSDISGKAVGACPNAKGLAKIAKTAAKVGDSAAKKCGSTCSVSGVPCMSNALCPPNAGGSGSGEQCSAGAKNVVFDMRDLGFPGPLCTSPVTNGAELGACIDGLTQTSAQALVDVLYGSITNASGISPDAGKCLASLSKAAAKLSSTIQKGVVKCRSGNLKLLEDPATNAALIINPSDCRKLDAKLAAKVAKAAGKLSDTAVKKCNDALILELDLCGNGVGGTADVATAAQCLTDAATEITDSQDIIGDRTHQVPTLIEAAFPPIDGACGDNVVNQRAGAFSKLGEECDGADDAACPGNCVPPGDVFECTCATEVTGTIKKYRHRFIADGFTADLDNGWTGNSHNSGVTDGAGYILEIDPLSCDCDNMDGLECIGTSADPICDTIGQHKPSCSWEPFSGVGCDPRGTDPDTNNEDEDCKICDEFSIGTGDACTIDADCAAGGVCVNGACALPCANDNGCSAQCFPAAGGAATIPCPGGQGDCAADEICRGQCDSLQTCLIVANGAPLPISAGGTSVCVLTTFDADIYGTMNILTGEHESFVNQSSKVHLGVSNPIPCPICGGFCKGGSQAGQRCAGSCDVPALDGSGSGTNCRFDDDCLVGEVCSAASSLCPESECNLSSVCRGGPNAGEPCRIEAATTIFGLTSSDCQPAAGNNISGQGLDVNFFPSTSETVVRPPTQACEAAGFGNYDCPCPSAGGGLVRPNRCAFACNAGAELGVGCGTAGAAIFGLPTVCTGGAEAGAPCDDDTDCSGGGLCDGNPTHCTGGAPADERKACTTNGDCGGGGVCGDACPSGRCTPLCLGGRGGDPEEGFCAGGPSFNHCSDPGNVFRLCELDDECDAVCTSSCNNGVPAGGSLTACDPLSGCPAGESCCGSCESARLCEAGTDGTIGTSDDFPGAGICIPDDRNCFANDLAAQGTDKLDDPSFGPNKIRTVSTFCVAGTGNAAINSTAGLGGPGRLRQNGINATNGYTSIP